MTGEPLLTVKDVAAQLGVSVGWVRDHVGGMPHRRIGRFIRFTQADVDEYVETSRRAAADPYVLNRRQVAAFNRPRRVTRG